MPPQDNANNQVPPVTSVPPVSNNVPPTAPVSGQSNNTLMAVLCYLGILIIVPFVTEAKNDPFVKFHIKQGLALIISIIIGMFIGIVPILGWILAPLLALFNLIMVIVGIVNAATGKQKQLPLIGGIAKNFNF